jgi:hypothetical protein
MNFLHHSSDLTNPGSYRLEIITLFNFYLKRVNLKASSMELDAPTFFS